MGTTDKLKEKGQATKGNLKKGVGRATRDPGLEAEGRGDQLAGNVKLAGEKLKDAVKR